MAYPMIPSLISGETVTVVRPTVTRNDIGEPTYGEPERTAIDGVAVAPGATADLDAGRPEGVTVAYTLHLPKTYQEPLRGCAVEVRGETYRVVGDPKPYTAANTPGPWNYTVEVEKADG